MHQRITKSSMTTETTYSFTHINTSTTKNTRINTQYPQNLLTTLCNRLSLKFQDMQ